MQTSEAAGAAGVQLGPRAHSAFAWLNKRLGLSHGKIQQAFRELFGISISRSTAARSCHRTARRCTADTTTVNLLAGGEIGRDLFAYDNSTVTVSDGTIGAI